MRIAIVIIFVFSGFSSRGQWTYPEADSISYSLYQLKKWKELQHFAGELKKSDITFYYLDLRAGKAAFETGKWGLAEKYFKDAIAKNPDSEFAKENLFRIYLTTRRRKKTAAIFNTMSDSAKAGLSYRPQKAVEELYYESCVRSSDNPDSAGNGYYYFAALTHAVSPAFRIGHSYSLYQQELYWCRFTQHQYTIAPTLELNGDFELSLAAAFIQFKRELRVNYESILFTEHTVIPSPMGAVIRDSTVLQSTYLSGASVVSAVFPVASLGKRWRDLSFNIQLGAYLEEVSPDYDSVNTIIYKTRLAGPDGSVNYLEVREEDSSVLNKSMRNNHFQAGGGLDYTLRLNGKSWIRPGLEVHTSIIDNQYRFAWIPYLELIVHNKFSLFGYYLQKGPFQLSIFNGSQVYTTIDRINHRFSLSTGIALTARTGLSLTWQHEKITDAFTGMIYSYHSGYAGIHVKF